MSLLVDLLLIAPRLALAWLKTKLPSRKSLHYSRRCPLCGWRFPWEVGTEIICATCQTAGRRSR